MSRNRDFGWVQAGMALNPLIARLAASRGATPEQCRVMCATGDVARAGTTSAGSVDCGDNDRQSGKVPLAKPV